MFSLKSIWSGVYTNKLVFNWFSERDREQCEWIWNYMQKNFTECSFFKPIAHIALYDMTYAILDYWNAGADTKKLFALKLKKAWDQKVYRNKQEGKSPLNTYISKDSKKMLDLMAGRRDEKIYQTLEKLIKKAYEERF